MSVKKNYLNAIKSSLINFGINSKKINYNLTNEELYSICLKKNLGCLTNNNVLAVNTGKFTGRSPKDRYIVKDEITENKVWWGDINTPISEENFQNIYKKLVSYISNKEIYVRDCQACASKKNILKIRTICEYPWSDIFCNNMFIRNTNEKKSDIDWTVISAPGFHADPKKISF